MHRFINRHWASPERVANGVTNNIVKSLRSYSLGVRGGLGKDRASRGTQHVLRIAHCPFIV